jgi:hypothetical protein
MITILNSINDDITNSDSSMIRTILNQILTHFCQSLTLIYLNIIPWCTLTLALTLTLTLTKIIKTRGNKILSLFSPLSLTLSLTQPLTLTLTYSLIISLTLTLTLIYPNIITCIIKTDKSNPISNPNPISISNPVSNSISNPTSNLNTNRNPNLP